jgi:hypothetical protein
MASGRKIGETKKSGKKARDASAVSERIRGLEREVSALREELKEEKEKREKAEEIFRKREPVLTERVKEISCLYSVVSLLGSRDYASEEDKIKDIVKIIPTGWYYPEDAWARITFGGKEYRTGNFDDTPWKHTAEITVEGEPQGTLTVGYLKEKPPREEGPFWLEERTLLDALAKLIGEIAGPKLRKEAVLRK